ncbi:hypothetical protein NWF32_01070 [Pseudomonas qingdaonensis]|nr:hypothetical protein [Pseudomonas qingdaonensis]
MHAHHPHRRLPHHLAREVQDLARQLDLPNGDQGIAVTLDGEP